MRFGMVVIFAMAMAGCDDGHQHNGHDHSDGKKDEHVHAAPHDGELVEIGDHYANVELVFDEDTGTLTLYALGAHAEQPARLAQESVDLSVRVGDGEPFDLSLAAQESPISGEKVGATSKFQGNSDQLKGVESFHITVKTITIKGQKFDDVKHAFTADHDHEAHK